MAVGNGQRGVLLAQCMAWLLILFALTACKNDPLSGANDPKDDSWNLDYIGPSYMSGWVEHITVEDMKGRWFRGPGGALGSGAPGLGKEYARGWGTIGGNFYPITGADLPRRIFVRWQSVVEQKTYKGWIEIPENARSIMRGSTARRCPDWPDDEANYSAMAIIGVAPGGVIKAWVKNNCLGRVLVSSAQAEIEPLGPYQGKSNGKYRPQEEPSKRYVERYGIPFGSW